MASLHSILRGLFVVTLALVASTAAWADDRSRDALPRVSNDQSTEWIRAIEVILPRERFVEGDWPVAECTLIAESGVSWQGLVDAIGVLEVAETAVMLAKPACDAIATLEVESTPLTLMGECVGGGVFDGFIAGTFEVTSPATFNWAGGMNNPIACATAETALETAWKASEIVAAYLECWTDGYLESNYKRLDTLQQELVGAYDDLALIYSIFVERSLHKTGGSSLAALYLPESAGGELESVAEIVMNAAAKTAEAGYILDPKYNTFLTAAQSAQSAGDYKRSFAMHRKAYQHATIQSQELDSGGTP